MTQWTTTTCDGCHGDEAIRYGGSGVFEGTPSSFDGWATLTRTYRTEPMTLSTGYVIESRERTATAHLCPECLNDPDVIDHFRYIWTPDRFDGAPFKDACARIDAAQELEDLHSYRIDILRIWVDLNGAPSSDREAIWRLEDYERAREELADEDGTIDHEAGLQAARDWAAQNGAMFADEPDLVSA